MRRRSTKLFISLTALGVVAFIFREKWLLMIGDFLIVEDTLHPADVIHVIAGDDYRTEYAIQLYQQGYGKTLFFTGGWCNFHDYYHGAHARALALAHDVPLEAIAFDETTVTSTYAEAERLRAWIAQSSTPVRSVIVVSDPFHMRRAHWTYQRIFGDSIAVQMAPVPFDRTPFQRTWWKDRQSRQNIREEYSKLLYYVFRYQYSRGFLREWLASLDAE